ncbi:MAG: diguanylate cyclase [Geobacter sp.]|nr:MAG: diguanylate cyclase [Geobacter sp.]
MEKPGILIIDDDRNLGRTLSDILTANGYHTFTAMNGTEGLALLERHCVKLALVDLDLPDISGIEVLEKIKAHSPLTEAIILTGNATLTSAIDATNRGAFSYLVKPYEIEQLILIIRRAVEKCDAQEKIAHHRLDLEKKNSELMALYNVSLAINRSIEMEGLLSGVLETLLEMELFHFEHKGAAFIVEGSTLRLVSHIGLSDAQVELCGSALSMDCLCGQAATQGEILFCRNCYEDARHIIHFSDMPIHSDVHLPLKTLDKVIGVISLWIQPEAKLGEMEIMHLTTIANLIGIAVNNSRLFEEAKTGALHDHLTGLPNRRFMQIQLEKCIDAAKRYGEYLSVIMLDIDHFKRYNDRQGHVQGDRLLVDLAGILLKELRSSDFVFRYGGEEFLIVLPRTDLKSSSDVAERLRKVLETETTVTVSLGVSTYQDGSNIEKLIHNADTALYRAKGEGRNRVAVNASF